MTSDFENLIHQRLSGFDPSYIGEDFTSVIKGNVTPVPFFGDYRNSSIVTIAINPSTKEFSRCTPSPSEESLRKSGRSTAPKTDRGLVHLSDLGLPQNFFHMNKRITNAEHTNAILQGLTEYFDRDSYNEKWFGKVEPILNTCFGASYFSSSKAKRACHLDISPWTTRRWRSTEVQAFKEELVKENRTFFRAFLSEPQFENLLILGGDTRQILEKEFPKTPFDERTNADQKKPKGPTFAIGWLEISGSIKKRFLYNSFSPSADQSVKNSNDREKSISEGWQQVYNDFEIFFRETFFD